MSGASFESRAIRRKLTVWIITVGEPLPYGHTAAARPWRSGLLAQMLAADGHDVTWWTSSVDHFSKTLYVDSVCEARTGGGVVLRFLHGRLYTKNVSLARVRNHREIARQFAELAPARAAPDVILCSYPTIELSAEAVRFGASRSIPVLIDIRDLWPDEMVARLPRVLRPFGGVLFLQMHREAAYALRGAAGLIGVSAEYLEWGLRHARRARNANDAVFTHGYPLPPAAEKTSAAAATWLVDQGIDASKRIFWFVGTFVGSKDLATVIDAARRVTDRHDVQFVLTGSGEQDAELRGRAAGLPNVVFTGWCDAERIGALAKIAWAGLGAYKRGTLVGLGNKVFEYMAHGLPVLICLDGEARAIVEDAGCGVFYEPESAESLEAAVRRLGDDRGLRDRMADAARRLFHERYNAALVYRRMADHLEAVAKKV